MKVLVVVMTSEFVAVHRSSFAAVLARERHHRVSRLVMISGGAPIPLGPQPGIFSMPECFLSCCQPLMLRAFRKSVTFRVNNIIIW